MKKSKDILTIETLEKFERLINLNIQPYDIHMMVMPGTLEDKHKNCSSIPALRRQFNLIYIFLSGEHDVKLGADHTVLKPNDLVIVPEHTLYASDHIQDCKGFCIHFKTEFIQPLLHKSITEEFPFFHFDTEHIFNLIQEECDLIQQSFKDILTEYDRFSPEKDYLLRNYILILLLRIREIYKKHGKQLNKTRSRGAQLANRFKYLVEKHFVESRTVHAYASKMNIDPNHLSDIVKKAFGRSPLEMIHDMLFLEAKVRLGSTDKTITEIAHALQFEDQAHFSHFIKKRSGLSPLELRRKL
jgi:AraC family transcriptional regulator, transcriptional activator of pobA